MRLNWLPWRYVVGRIARRYGFLNPLEVIGHLTRFGQPSEVSAPMELLRAGVVFHARGLMNTKAIQYNLDWAWPYWVQRQFDPRDPSFVPRAFSFTHVNLSQRNWTAVGVPNGNAFPIVDPRGLVTPFWDGWSLDAWLMTEEGGERLPARTREAEQRLELGDPLSVRTRVDNELGGVTTTLSAEARDDTALCRVRYQANTTRDGWLAVSLRPFNPEGVSFVYNVEALDDRRWEVNGRPCLTFADACERTVMSEYAKGDVYARLLELPPSQSVSCPVGLATAAALFPVTAHTPRVVEVEVNLNQDRRSTPLFPSAKASTWSEELTGSCRAELPDKWMQFLFEAAVHTLVLLSPKDVYPGPYTYKRFWFRDAALIVNGMLAAGLVARSTTVVDQFAKHQRHDGFFLSQEGEWDSNGAALWALGKLARVTDAGVLRTQWASRVKKSVRWFEKKHCKPGSGELHAGLLPAGFSAEHLGNNDYYYWDDFFAMAGLDAAAYLCEAWGDRDTEELARRLYREFDEAVERSLEQSADTRRHAGIPASPYRRLDAGAIGSLAAAYPLLLTKEKDTRMLATVQHLMDHSLVDGAFFQDMIHSGQNAYLTLMLAQVLLRAGDTRFFQMVETVAQLASPTGQWPEAIHPRTGGGCMGDGQHAWAAAEWVMMIRNMLVREEQGRLVLASGLPPKWLQENTRIQLGPSPTPWGPVTVTVTCRDRRIDVSWEGQWRGERPPIEVGPVADQRITARAEENAVTVTL